MSGIWSRYVSLNYWYTSALHIGVINRMLRRELLMFPDHTVCLVIASIINAMQINLLVPELYFLILTHPVYKM